MVHYVKFDEEMEPTQFTTALEAKEHIEANFEDVVYVSSDSDPEKDVGELDFVAFEDKESAREAIDHAHTR